MANSANLPAPYQGVNEKIPAAGLKSPNCETLLNFNTNQAGISLRKGDAKYSTFTRAISDPLGLYPYGDTKLFAAVYRSFGAGIDFTDAETGTVEFTTGNQLSITAVNSLFFNNYLFFFFNTATFAPGYHWNGAAMAATTYTGNVANFWPIGGNVYNKRAYLIQLNEPAYWYTPLSAITGVCTKVSLGEFLQQKATLSAIASFTLSENATIQYVQAFIFSNGEILFYTGSYPDSADWTLLGSAKIGQPLFAQSVIPYQGDTLIMCDSGVVSLRDLFQRGSQKAIGLSVNSLIQRSWRALVQDMRRLLNRPNGPITGGYLVGNVRGVYDPKSDRIIISFPYYLQSNGAATNGSYYFIFDNQLEAWYHGRSFGGIVYDIAAYKNKVLLLGKSLVSSTYMVWEKEGSTGYMDRRNDDASDVGYDYTMTSAPIPFPKTAVYETTGIEPIIQSDLYTETNWTLISDFGKQTTNNQNISDTMGTSITKPLVNAGIQNITYVQVAMNGTTVAGKTVGLDLYSYNVWYNSGDIGSR